MKTLFLIRHAKSSWKDQSLRDSERLLNNRGKRDAPFMAKLLREKKVEPDLIISSPTLRAMTTARIFAKELKYGASNIVTNDLLYHGDLRSILGIIQGLEDSNETVVLIGHNPEITSLANILTGAAVDNIPTCGIMCLEFEVDTWRRVNTGTGNIRYFEKPKKYFK